MINITIISKNEKIIDIINMSDNNIVNSITDNQSAQLEYSNYVLDVKAYSTDFTFNNLFSNLDSLTADITIIFLIFLLIISFFTIPKILRRLTR